jgi:hypothetical protein
MPQGHHHHENKRDKRNTRLMQQAKRAREQWAIIQDKAMPVIDIGEKRISEIIRFLMGISPLPKKKNTSPICGLGA